MPKYDFNDFLEACGKGPAVVFVDKTPENDAREIFNLKTKKELLDFIANDGLQNLKFVNTKPYDYNPSIIIDAYEFRTLNMLGYLAFYQNDATKKWNIKSFHLSNSNLNFKPLEIAFNKAFCIPTKEK